MVICKNNTLILKKYEGGSGMTIQEIKKDFERLGITESNYLDYNNLNAYDGEFKQCSMLKEANVSYATSIRDIMIGNRINK